MYRINKTINKTENSDLLLYSNNSDDIFNLNSGCFRIQLSISSSINNGVLSICSDNKYLKDYMIFSINQNGKYMDYPGIYCAFSSSGIIFTIWTKNGRFSVLDKTTSIEKNTSFLLDFCWDRSRKLGSKSTMAIFVNNICTASGDFCFHNHSLSGKNVYMFDSKDLDFNLNCSISDIACFNSLPVDRIGKVFLLSNYKFSDDEILIGGKTNNCLITDGDINNCSYLDFSSIPNHPYYLGICDISGDIFYARCFSDGYKSCSINKFKVSESKIEKSFIGLEFPVSISMIQYERIDYPRYIYIDNTSCDGIWASDKTRLFRFNSSLESQIELTGFSSIYSIKTMNDKSCWVADKDDNILKHISYIGENLENITISSPIFLSTTINDIVYCYSTNNFIYQIQDGIIKRKLNINQEVISLDVCPVRGDVFVALNNGLIRKYSSQLKLIKEINYGSEIYSICIRRGYKQDSLLVFDKTNNKISNLQYSDISNTISEKYIDENFIPNGSVFCTSKSYLKSSLKADFDIYFDVNMSVTKNIEISSYKVNESSVDFSGGKENNNYNNKEEILNTNSPTDYQGLVVKTYKLPYNE